MADTLEYIDAYFQQTLNDDERKAFEKRIENDEAFAEEVAFYVASRQAIREKLLEQKTNQWKHFVTTDETISSAPPKKIFSIRSFIPYAAAACLLLAVVIYFLQQPASPKELATNYVKNNYTQLSQTMDASKDSLQLGIAAYNKKEYNNALPLFQGVYERHNNNTDALKYAGLVYLVTERYDEAITRFDTLANIYGLYSNPGLFLKAVTLMQRNKQGDKEKAKQLLEQVKDQNLEGSKEAEEWLRKW
jgi:tetratricopeptide (TPR) repeat protein